MAIHRPDISNKLKKRLRAEAGQKCANPGCANLRTHIHHIREWAVYQSHDELHMIAVCPSCHDAIHHGSLRIDDQLLYRWKSIPRNSQQVRSILFVEPARESRLLLGTIAVTSSVGVTVFDFTPSNRLSFTVKDGDILLLELSVTTLAGEEIIRVTDNHVRHNRKPAVAFHHVPGAVEVITPANQDFLPAWAMRQMQSQQPSFGRDGTMKALSLQVLEPGLVRIQGVWAQPDKAFVITDERFYWLQPSRFFSLVGDGKDSVLSTGSSIIRPALFGFSKD